MPNDDREQWLEILRELEALTQRIEALPVTGSQLRPFRRAVRGQSASCLETAHELLSSAVHHGPSSEY